MRILLLTHYYWPEVGAPQRRWHTLVKHLIDRGHQIVVAAPHPHYPHKGRDEFFNSSVGIGHTKVQVRVGGTWEHGELGEKILRLPYLYSGNSMVRQILDQSVSAVGAVSAIARRMRGTKSPDVIISTIPGLPFLLAGDALSLALKVPHIAEVRDAWPDLIHELSLVSNAAGKYLPHTLTRPLENTILPNALTRAQRRAACVVVTTEGFCARLRRRGISAEVVRSGVGQSEIETAVKQAKAGSSRKPSLNLLYVGTVGRSQSLSYAIKAAAQVPGARLRIVGDGADKTALKILAVEQKAPVQFFEQATGKELANHWEWADAGLVCLGAVPAHQRTVPSKLYSLMVRQIPILGIVAGEAADIITQTGAGMVAHPSDVGSIVDAMHTMALALPRPDEQGRRWVIDNASAAVMGEEFDRILRQVCE